MEKKKLSEKDGKRWKRKLWLKELSQRGIGGGGGKAKRKRIT